MASLGRGVADSGRRTGMSPRPRGRENAKDTLCRNVTIYGHCRYENKGCAFNHDPTKAHNQTDAVKKRLNVDSPSFTPSASSSPSLSVNGLAKTPGISPKAANAAPFKPKGLGGNDLSNLSRKAPTQYNPSAPDWSMAPSADIPDFVPQQQAVSQNMNPNPGLPQGIFDPYGSSPSMADTAHSQSAGQINPYLHDQAANGGAPFYSSNAFTQPLNYHLYVSQAPQRDHLSPNQRTARDFFISDTLREELQRKSAATLQVLPNSNLPQSVDYFHSLVPLDTNNQKNPALFNHPSWVYKVQSAKDGRFYALRRLEGFRLTNENAVITVRQSWKKIVNANIVSIVDIFTSRSFGDAGLMVVTDYFPLSKTLAEAHLSGSHANRVGYRSQGVIVPEPVLWSYFVQIANALKTIHVAGLAARVLDPTKILLTSKNRLRLNGCAILDVVHFDASRSTAELQLDDLAQLGKLMLVLGTNNRGAMNNTGQALEQFGRSYSIVLKERVAHLIGAGPPGSAPPRIDTILAGLEGHIISVFDGALHQDDGLNQELCRELENSRIARLMVKLNFITERPEYGMDRQWSETGERYPIKLFRDYVFHQVDANGNPNLNLGWVIACLNKLDAGSEEKMRLVTRDEQTMVVLSFKEMKRLVEGAYQELVRASHR